MVFFCLPIDRKDARNYIPKQNQSKECEKVKYQSGFLDSS